MNSINIRKLDYDDLKQFKKFVDKYWKKNHIFATDDKIFNWQYKKKNVYNFFIAKKKSNLIGVQGFIPINHFDKNLNEKLEIWNYENINETNRIAEEIKKQIS